MKLHLITWQEQTLRLRKWQPGDNQVGCFHMNYLFPTQQVCTVLYITVQQVLVQCNYLFTLKFCAIIFHSRCILYWKQPWSLHICRTVVHFETLNWFSMETFLKREQIKTWQPLLIRSVAWGRDHLCCSTSNIFKFNNVLHNPSKSCSPHPGPSLRLPPILP